MSPKNSRTKRNRQRGKSKPELKEKTGTGMGGQGGYGKRGNPLGSNAEQDYEHGKGFPKR